MAVRDGYIMSDYVRLSELSQSVQCWLLPDFFLATGQDGRPRETTESRPSASGELLRSYKFSHRNACCAHERWDDCRCTCLFCNPAWLRSETDLQWPDGTITNLGYPVRTETLIKRPLSCKNPIDLTSRETFPTCVFSMRNAFQTPHMGQ